MEAIPASPRSQIIRRGFAVALVSGAIVWGLGSALIAIFGLLSFAKTWALFFTIPGLMFLTLYAPGFLPAASLVALPASWKAAHTLESGYSRKKMAMIFLVAILLLSAVSLPVTFLIVQRGHNAAEEDRREWRNEEQARQAIKRITELQVRRENDSILLEPIIIGEAAGLYRAVVAVRIDGKTLVSETMEARLPADETAFSFSVPISEIQSGYRRERLEGNARVAVESTFGFIYTLELMEADDEEIERIIPAGPRIRGSSENAFVKIDLGTF